MSIYFKINSKTLSRNPNNIEQGKFKLQNSDRAIDGTLVVDIIAVKNKVTFNWDYLTQADMQNLNNEINAVSFPVIEYMDIDSNILKCITGYAEDISYKPHYDSRTNSVIWTEVKVSFIEK